MLIIGFKSAGATNHEREFWSEDVIWNKVVSKHFKNKKTMIRLFALTFSLALMTTTFLTKCRTEIHPSATKSFDFTDNYLTVKRTIDKIDENKYKIVVEIKSPVQLEGYVTIDDSFPNPI